MSTLKKNKDVFRNFPIIKKHISKSGLYYSYKRYLACYIFILKRVLYLSYYKGVKTIYRRCRSGIQKIRGSTKYKYKQEFFPYKYWKSLLVSILQGRSKQT